MSEGMVVVAGAGGFIGGHLVASLRAKGRRVRAVDIKPLSEWYQHVAGAHDVVADLKDLARCREAMRDAIQARWYERYQSTN